MTEHYKPGASGWVVRNSFDLWDGTRHVPFVSWWYGPDHAYGTTSGALDYSVAVFPTKRAAADAVRSTFGRLVASRHTIERVAEAEGYRHPS